MNVWVDPDAGRVLIGLADSIVIRLTLTDAARLRDELVGMLGGAQDATQAQRDLDLLSSMPVSAGDGRRRPTGPRYTAPTGL